MHLALQEAEQALLREQVSSVALQEVRTWGEALAAERWAAVQVAVSAP